MRTSILLAALMLTLPGCRKERIDVDNLLGGEVIVQGHGGMGIHSLYPLDSPASVLACLHSGADGVEVDVQLSKDSVLVAFHDEDLSVSTDMSGAVVDHTWEELSTARFVGPNYTEHRLMRLDQFMDQLGDPGRFHWSLDLKPYPSTVPEGEYLNRFARAVARLINDRGLSERCYLESQQTYLLLGIRQHLPSARLFIYPADFAQGYADATVNGLSGISIDMAKITREQVEQAHASGLWVTVWNAQNRDDNTDALRLGPEIIQSDRVEHLVDLMD